MAGDISPEQEDLNPSLEESLAEMDIGTKERNEELHNLVFGMDLLREKIVNFVIHDGNGQVSLKNASIYRLVHRSWLKSVQKCLLKSAKPLIKFNLSAEHTTPAIHPFLAEYSSSSRIIDSIPPFSINLKLDYFENFGEGGRSYKQDVKAGQYNMNLLEKCFRFCNDALISLELDLFYYCKQPVKLNVPENLRLPVLHDFSVRLPDFLLMDAEDDTAVAVRSSNIANTTAFVQSILLACEKLCDFSVEGLSGRDLVSLPICETLRLPPTINRLPSRRMVTTGDLEKLMRNNEFPNLTQMNIPLNMPKGTEGKECLYRILERVRLTLKLLVLYRENKDAENTTISLPLMPRLEILSLESKDIAWAEGIARCDKSVPNLAILELNNVTHKMLHGFVKNSKFEAVQMLTVALPTGTSSFATARNQSLALSLSLARMPRTFPNVSHLNISFAIRNDCPQVLHPILQNMTGLRVLKITTLEDETSSLTYDPFFWCTFFLGNFPNVIIAGHMPYIAHLRELQELSLHYPSTSRYAQTPAVLTDEVFNLGFLKMPKLKTIATRGRFLVSPVMKIRWSLAGRCIYG